MATYTGPVTRISALEACVRWNSGKPIAMASEPEYFQRANCDWANAYTASDLGMTWSELISGGNNATTPSFAKPAPVCHKCGEKLERRSVSTDGGAGPASARAVTQAAQTGCG